MDGFCFISFSTNQMQNLNQSRLGRACFPALLVVSLFLPWVVICSSVYFPFFWLVVVITLALVLRHSFNKQSISIQLSNQCENKEVGLKLFTLGSRTFQNMLWIPFCWMSRPGENLTVPDPNQKGTDTSFSGGLGKVLGEVSLPCHRWKHYVIIHQEKFRETPQAEWWDFFPFIKLYIIIVYTGQFLFKI